MGYTSKFKGSEIDALLEQVQKGGTGGGGSATLMTEIAWADLVALRDAGNLVAGMKYRIIDYETMTSKAGSQSAGHLFDIVVTALDSKTLDEKASAIQSARDTEGYFANSNLAAWDVRYCLDNDKERFDWAVKVETLLMIDLTPSGLEQTSAFTPNGTFEYNGASYYRWDATIMDMAVSVLTATNTPSAGESVILYAHDYGSPMDNVTVVELYVSTDNGFGIIYRLIDENRNDIPYDFKNLQFIRKITDGALDTESGTDTYCYTFSDFSTGALLDASESSSTTMCNKFGAFCWNNVFLGNTSYSNTFGDYCESNTFGDKCTDSAFGNRCYSNTFGKECDYNTFGSGCYSNTFGDYCESNTFGSGCYSNTFVKGCYRNTFGKACFSNTFGRGCYSNTFGDYCHTNTFGSGCTCNTFGQFCYFNTFGDNCHHNTFGSDCGRNTFGTTEAPLSNIQYYKVDYAFRAEIAAIEYREFVTYVTTNASGVAVQYTADTILNA